MNRIDQMALDGLSNFEEVYGFRPTEEQVKDIYPVTIKIITDLKNNGLSEVEAVMALALALGLFAVKARATK